MPNICTHTALTISMRYVVTSATVLGISDFKVDTRTHSINDICTPNKDISRGILRTTSTLQPDNHQPSQSSICTALQSGQHKRALTILVDASWEFDISVLKEKQKGF